MLPPFVPIPFEHGAIFVDVNHDITPVRSVSWPCAWNSTEDVIVYVTSEIVFCTLDNGEIAFEHRLELPVSFEALCVFFANDYVFIGGKGGEKKILCFCIDDVKPIEVEHPNILKKYRKSIDEFFVWEDLIYAVDNHIHPKYLLGYQLHNDIWKCVNRIKLEGHSPEERVKGAVLLNNTLVLLSRSSHRAGTTTFLSFYPNLAFERYVCWHKTLGSTGITEIYKIRIFQNDLILITNVGVYLLPRDGAEDDVLCVSLEKYLVDVYPYENQPWVGIVSKFGKKKKVLIHAERGL